MAVLSALARAAAAATSQAPSGPRKRILVDTFETVTAFDTAFGGPEAGAALAAQLATQLEQTGQYDVLERSDYDAIVKERNLNAANASIDSDGGKLLGAQIIVHGFVSTYTANAKDKGFSIGLGDPATQSLTGALSKNSATGVIGIELKLIDTTTSQVIGSTHLESTVRANSTGVGITGPVNAGKTSSTNPVLGNVTRDVLHKAVDFIGQKLQALGWAGEVADVNGDQVFLNVGQASGARVGDQFAISRVTRKIVDPSSGELLGVIEDAVGTVSIVSAADKFSVAEKQGEFDVHPGDVARYIQKY
jgi:curli biogenesis system outer membrane secretion channel CsgG